MVNSSVLKLLKKVESNNFIYITTEIKEFNFFKKIYIYAYKHFNAKTFFIITKNKLSPDKVENITFKAETETLTGDWYILCYSNHCKYINVHSFIFTLFYPDMFEKSIKLSSNYIIYDETF